MAIVTPSDDILVCGHNLYSFKASSAISGGALVKIEGTYEVVHTDLSTDNTIGVALDEVGKGDYVTVAGPGCIVRCCASAAIDYGADLYASETGKVDDTLTYGGTSPCIGVALESQTSANGAIRVLLK